jgi:hypothetical protein
VLASGFGWTRRWTATWSAAERRAYLDDHPQQLLDYGVHGARPGRVLPPPGPPVGRIGGGVVVTVSGEGVLAAEAVVVDALLTHAGNASAWPLSFRSR